MPFKKSFHKFIRIKLLVYVAYVSLLIASFLFWQVTEVGVDRVIKDKLSSEVDLVNATVEAEIKRAHGALLDFRAHFHNLTFSQNSDFSDFIQNAHFFERFPAIEGFGFSQVLNASPHKKSRDSSQQDSLVLESKIWPKLHQDLPNLIISKLIPSTKQNRLFIGYNLYMHQKVATSLQNAFTANTAVLVPLPKPHLNQVDQEKQTNRYILALPAYKTSRKSGLIDASPKNRYGFFFAKIRIHNFVENKFRKDSIDNTKINFSIYDDTDLIYDNKGLNITGFEHLKVSKKIHLFGKTWLVEASPKTNMLSFYERYAPEAVLLSLLILSVLIIFLITYSQKYLQQEAEYAEKAKVLVRKAEAANATKTSFLANMSHEIRTPLVAIMGYTELLSEDNRPLAEKKTMLENIRRNGESLLKILNDILDVSKTEFGKIKIEKRSLSVVKLMNEIESDLNLKAFEKKIFLKFIKDTGFDKNVISDRVRLKQIITNLINNALRFTSIGGVEVKYGIENSSLMFFEVKDTGIGISEGRRDFLFNAFEQEDSTTTRQFGGTGLGLNLSRALAKELGGNVFLVRSEKGVGSTFRLELPYIEAPHETAVKSEKKSLKADVNLSGKNILLVEDSKENLNLFKIFLESAGANVELATDGKEALTKGQSFALDVILMDIQIPKLDGKEVTKTLRKLGIKTPIVAITAHAFEEEIKSCIAAGCTIHLAKPFSKEQLLNVVEENLRT